MLRRDNLTYLQRFRGLKDSRSASLAFLLFIAVGVCISDSVVEPPRGDCASPAASTDLRHCDFNGANLAGRDLSGVRLDAVDFDNANLSGCKLTGASLVGAILRWVKLVEADLSDAMDIPEHLAKMLAGKGR